MRQTLSIETGNLKVYVEEQLKGTSNKLQEYHIQVTEKVAAVREELEQTITRIDTQRYLDGLQQTVVMGELQHQQEQLQQQQELHSKEL